MAGGEGEGDTRDLEHTPTWAVATVCASIIIISFLLEKGLHRIGEWLSRKHKKSLYAALQKIKSELMILGFISLLLTFGQSQIVKICVPAHVADTMLPCSLKNESTKKDEGHRRRLLSALFTDQIGNHRILSADSSRSCPEGKTTLVSQEGLHQLHILIFFLAVFHVVNSGITMALGRAKIRGWKEWEKETSSDTNEFSNDPSRFRFAHETSFVRRHSSVWNRNSLLLYIVSFFRQIFSSVRKTDYLTLRHGFVNAHLAPGTKFNFQKYIKRTLEDDFGVVVGISAPLWASAVLVLLLNVRGWQGTFWVSIIPLLIILAVGTKLQAIITQMAIDIQEKHSVIQGTPLVQLSDHHFWFGRPHFVLFLIHFALFQNAFQITYFLWTWYEFGLRSCMHKNFSLIIARNCIGVGVLILCSYVTLPLYALVSQMGTYLKTSIFDEQTSSALKKWKETVKKKKNNNNNNKQGKGSSHSSHSTNVTSKHEPSPISSPVHLLHRYKTIGHPGDVSSAPKIGGFFDNDHVDTEIEMSFSLLSSNNPNREDSGGQMTEHSVIFREHQQQHQDDDFSFAKTTDQLHRQSSL